MQGLGAVEAEGTTRDHAQAIVDAFDDAVGETVADAGEDTAEATKEIEAALAEADAWIEMSGAKSYQPSSTSSGPSWRG